MTEIDDGGIKEWGMNEPLNNNERRGHEFDDLSDS
jgi:hypothetical protein